MGQPVVVINKPSGRAGILSFELNRSVTGMGHRNYFFSDFVQGLTSGEAADEKSEDGEAPAPPTYGSGDIADRLAHQIFQNYGEKGVAGIHINSNVIILSLTDAVNAETGAGATNAASQIDEAEILGMLEQLFLHYK